MDRRTFLVQGGRAALGWCLLPAASRAQGAQNRVDSEGGAANPALAAFEDLIPELMQAGRVPGVSIAFIREAKPIWMRGFGVKNAQTQEPVEIDALFEAASVSKSVFAYAVLKLCERRILDLDTPLTTYAKVRPLADDPRLDLITARHVLSHTSGFQNWRSDADPLKIHFPPGEKFLYSGEGYSYLQSVVSEVSRQPIEDFMRANLFEPFGMTASGYTWNEAYDRHVTRKHDREGKLLPKSKPTAEDAARYAAAGSLYTTPADYAKFLIEILAPKPADAHRLTPTSIAEMLRPHTTVDDTSSWALGWKIQHTPGGDLFQHHGGHKGAQVFASASREKKSGYVVMTNSDNGWKVFFDEKFVSAANRFLLG